MRTLTQTLLEAQRAAQQSPSIRLKVRDRRPRFYLLGSQAVEDVQSVLCTTSSGAPVVAVLDKSGNVRVRVVPFPYNWPDWGAYPADYALVATGAKAWPDGDVALGRALFDSTIRLFYFASNYLVCHESTDGTNWSAAQNVAHVYTSPGLVLRAASGGQHDVFWWQSSDRRVRFCLKSGVSWTVPKQVGAYGLFGSTPHCWGLSAQWDSAKQRMALLGSFGSAASGREPVATAYLQTCLVNLTDGEVSSLQQIVPPGSPAVGSAAIWPSLLKDSIYDLDDQTLEDRWIITYIDKFQAQGLPASRQAMAILSRDFNHWSYKIPLGFNTAYENRLALVAPAADRIFAHHTNELYKLLRGYYGLNVSQKHILSYRIEERPLDGQLSVILDNRDGSFDSPGQQEYDALKPLADVSIEQGLKTEAGEERVESRRFYLWSVSRERSKGSNWARLEARDGWQLFRRWHADGAYTWQGKTLKWLIEELASRVAYLKCEFDDSLEWQGTVVQFFGIMASQRHIAQWWPRWIQRRYPYLVPEMRFAEEVSGLTVLQGLLGLVGGMARFGHGDHRGVLYCFIPAKQGANPAAAHAYQEGEILAGAYEDSFAWPTRVRVVGAEMPSIPATGRRYTYQIADTTKGLEAGMDFFDVLYSDELGSAAQCQLIAQGVLDDAQARAYGGWIQTRPNAGLELWDVVQFTDSKAGAGISAKRRVNGLLTEYQPLKSLWQQRLYLEAP